MKPAGCDLISPIVSSSSSSSLSDSGADEHVSHQTPDLDGTLDSLRDWEMLFDSTAIMLSVMWAVVLVFGFVKVIRVAWRKVVTYRDCDARSGEKGVDWDSEKIARDVGYRGDCLGLHLGGGDRSYRALDSNS